MKSFLSYLCDEMFFLDVSKAFKIGKSGYVSSYKEEAQKSELQGSPSGKMYLGKGEEQRKKKCKYRTNWTLRICLSLLYILLPPKGII